MRKLVTAVSALTLTLALAGTAAAQDRHANPAPDVAYTFDDDHVEGGLQGTDLERIRGTHRMRRESLVRARLHFVPEMVKSVESI